MRQLHITQIDQHCWKIELIEYTCNIDHVIHDKGINTRYVSKAGSTVYDSENKHKDLGSIIDYINVMENEQ